MNYGHEITFETIVRDETGRKIDKYKWARNEIKVFINILKIWIDKYNLDLKINEQVDSVFDL